MKSSARGVVIGVVLLAGLGWWEWSYRSSPGRLDPPHSIVPAFQGGQGCALCHGNGATAMVDACGECHGFVRREIEARHGVHGIVDAKLAVSCGECHAEHNGGRIELVTDESFARCGFADRKRFDHSRVTRYTLTGRHDRLRCDQCHRDANVSELPPAHKRYAGLSQRCVSCHDDVHKGAYGSGCAECHGQDKAFGDSPKKAEARSR